MPVSVKPMWRSSASRAGIDWPSAIARYGTIFTLVAVTVALSISTPSFLTPTNVKNLLTQAAVLGIIAVGLTFVMIPGELDMSMGSILTIAGVLAVGMMSAGRGLWIALAVALGAGLAVGLLNGIISVYGRVSSLIATLTIAAIVDGLSLLYTGGYRLFEGILPSYRFLGIGDIAGIPTPIVILAAVVGLAFLLAHRTALGRRIYAVGGNLEAAYLAGIDAKRSKIYAFILCGLASALAGIVVTARIGTAEPFARFAYALDAYAVVFMGTTISAEGEPHIPGTLLGILILGVLNNGMTLLGVPFFAQNIFKGLLILATVLASSLIRGRRA